LERKDLQLQPLQFCLFDNKLKIAMAGAVSPCAPSGCSEGKRPYLLAIKKVGFRHLALADFCDILDCAEKGKP